MQPFYSDASRHRHGGGGQGFLTSSSSVTWSLVRGSRGEGGIKGFPSLSLSTPSFTRPKRKLLGSMLAPPEDTPPATGA